MKQKLLVTIGDKTHTVFGGAALVSLILAEAPKQLAVAGKKQRKHFSQTVKGKARIASYMRRYSVSESEAIDMIAKSGLPL